MTAQHLGHLGFVAEVAEDGSVGVVDSNGYRLYPGRVVRVGDQVGEVWAVQWDEDASKVVVWLDTPDPPRSGDIVTVA